MKKGIIIGAGIVVLGIVWALFRPELLFINEEVNEGLPGGGGAASASSAGPVRLARGEFHGVAHATKGTAAIHRLAGGERVLRLTGFETSNGPALHVYLIEAPDASDNDTVKKGFADLGALKGNVGDQNYDIPANVDLSKYNAVTIWCQRFGVNFATAPLARESGAAAASAPAPTSTGRFHGVAHQTKGTASIYEVAGGERVLRLTGFETSNGPALHVYLIEAPDASDNDTVKKGFADLGALKGNVGDQNYDIPAAVDLSKYNAVTIWCQRFGVNFATAPLARS